MQRKKGKTADRTKIVEQGQSGVAGKQTTDAKIHKIIKAKPETEV